jgi:peptide/nickel transport system permease protein
LRKRRDAVSQLSADLQPGFDGMDGGGAAPSARRSLRPGSFGGVARVLWSRLVELVTTVLIAAIGCFLLLRVIPGDPASVLAGEASTTPQQLNQIRQSLNLNEPVLTQLVKYLGGALHGDLGESYFNKVPVTDLIAQTLPRTMSLVVFGIVVAILIGLPLGITAAVKVGSRTDTVVRVLATLGLAVPNFWLGMILVSVFALQLGWFPATGWVTPAADPTASFEHLVLPGIALGAVMAAELARQTRSAMIEALGADSIRTLRAMGLGNLALIWQHALKNSSIPIVTLLGLNLNRAISGAIVIEAIFGLPGIGTQVQLAAQDRDYPVVQGVVLATVVLVVLANFLLDIVYTWLDPRTRLRSTTLCRASETSPSPRRPPGSR